MQRRRRDAVDCKRSLSSESAIPQACSTISILEQTFLSACVLHISLNVFFATTLVFLQGTLGKKSVVYKIVLHTVFVCQSNDKIHVQY